MQVSGNPGCRLQRKGGEKNDNPNDRPQIVN